MYSIMGRNNGTLKAPIHSLHPQLWHLLLAGTVDALLTHTQKPTFLDNSLDFPI